MRLAGLDVIVVGNPPPGFGGRYFIFVKVTTVCGIAGWGEVYAATVGPAAMQAVIADVFARHMEGENPENIELMFRRVYSAGFSQRPDPTVMGAFSGLEIACWDLLGKARERPVHALWGGRLRDRLRAYTYLYPRDDQDPASFYNDPDASAEAAAALVERHGFTAVKFDPAGPYTIHGGRQPAMAELDRAEAFCRAVRAAVGDRADLLFGTHGQFTTSGAIRLARRIEPYDPLWFEEPVPPDNPLEMGRVAAAVRVPVAAGERLTTKQEFAALLRAGGAGVVQPSLGRVGGLLEARKIAAMAEGFNAQVAPHLYAGPVAWAAAAQLAASLPNFLLLETILTGGGFHGALIGGAWDWDDGHVRLPDRPGLGVELDEALARAHPWRGERLHLEMQAEEADPRGARFGGG
ncbi:mandelate racemase/muconate lactonizing enzyme family protein [Amaricoccus sp.]|uniref:mandelate racemase/muconate lactonizing enzyme family protein n=1 Tax=Amaricoccus sp. TaxID=1872485 RepID=UPI001B6C492E|nr:mandelate racemase/muconate lactonizing enzyme family protein [Amaricoccus sp.]MBP7242151.1 mandelate racemase/muconate lactonizing enzyme family protein [Amaricoccus sp.]